MSSRKIIILFLENDRPEGYGISAYADIWREEGFSVEYVFGTRRHVPADLLFLHINLSVVPDSVIEFANRYPRVVNLHARDIRSRTFCPLLVSQDSNYPGEVIVKTDLNHGGVPEARFHPNLWVRLFFRWQTLRLKCMNPVRDWKGGLIYPVFPSIRDVPKACWNNRHWVVEKFLPERMDGHYVVRNYRFMGASENSLMLVSEKPFIREDKLVRIERIPSEPRLRELRLKLKMDYGKIDYVLVDGEPVPFDINKTLGFNPGASHNPTVVSARKEMAQGIYSFLD